MVREALLPLLILVAAGIAAAVLTRLRRRAEPRRLEALAEVRADDPSPTPPASPLTMPDVLIRARQFLTDAWGEDTPDLLVSVWEMPREQAPRLAWDQRFIPFDGGAAEALEVIEEHLRAKAIEEGMPREAVPKACWTFVNVPESGGDLVIRSGFHPLAFRHQCYLLGVDGALQPLPGMNLRPVEDLFKPVRHSYRSAVHAYVEHGDAETARDEFGRLLANDVTHAGCHAWLAGIARREEGEPDAVRRHLCFAQEFGAERLLTQIEAAYLGTNEPRMLKRLGRQLADAEDGDGLLPFLLAQSFLALNNGRISRQLCERLLEQHPEHPHAAGLLRLIDQRDRGAQT